MTDFWLGFLTCWGIGWLASVLGLLHANADIIYPPAARDVVVGTLLLALLWPLALYAAVAKVVGR